jgi:Tfp pilus assembly PilM family ATPase
MDIDGLALLNCYLECEEREAGKTTALLRIGDNFSNLVILPDGGLPFVRDIPHAATEIIGQIGGEHVSPEAIGDTFYGWRRDGRHDQAIRNGMEAACAPLIAEVTETLRYYALHEGQAVDKIFVCGYLGIGQDLCNLLDSRLSPKVVLWNPFEKMQCDSSRGSDIIKAHGHSLALAAGLAMRTI